jgi:hypothetical protein
MLLNIQTKLINILERIVELRFETPERNSHYATSPKVAGSIPDEVIRIFSWPNPSSSTVALGSTQPVTEMSTRNLPGGKGRPACKADNLTTIYESVV